MESFTRISVQKACDIMQADVVTIVDVRDPASYNQGHIARAQMVDDGNINVFLQGTDKEAPLICYCYHGHSSQQAAHYFAQQGFKHVYSIDGGWEEWKSTYG